jgi:hypothetical protein
LILLVFTEEVSGDDGDDHRESLRRSLRRISGREAALNFVRRLFPISPNQRQGDRESGSAVFAGAFRTNRSAVHLDQMPHDREP